MSWSVEKRDEKEGREGRAPREEAEDEKMEDARPNPLLPNTEEVGEKQTVEGEEQVELILLLRLLETLPLRLLRRPFMWWLAFSGLDTIEMALLMVFESDLEEEVGPAAAAAEDVDDEVEEHEVDEEEAQSPVGEAVLGVEALSSRSNWSTLLSEVVSMFADPHPSPSGTPFNSSSVVSVAGSSKISLRSRAFLILHGVP